MKKNVLLLTILIFISYSQVMSQCYDLVWSDEFDYNGLPNSSNWGYDVMKPGTVNSELQNYTYQRLENARVENGKLIIEARRDYYQGYEYSSARLVTKGKGDWLYGRVEVRAKLPSARGTWPAIWMLPTDWAYGNWPNSGELDIMEYVGYEQNKVHASVHTQEKNFMVGGNFTEAYTNETVEEDFHTYIMEWRPDRIDFFFDDIKYASYYNEGRGSSQWPFDKRFHIILNLAIGGNWGGLKGVDNTAFPQRMEVDFVKVYKLRGADVVSLPYNSEIISLPGLIEAENYNTGCKGTSFFDKEDENLGKAYRTEGVDIENTGDVGGGYNVGYINSGEFLTYDVEVLQQGTYTFNFRVAGTGTGAVGLEVDGVKLFSNQTISPTGGWQTWNNVKVQGVKLTAGKKQLRLTFNAGGFNLNYFNVELVNTDPVLQPYTGTPIVIPGRIEAEAYDIGGTGVAFNDLTATNLGGAFRTDAVDIENCTEGGYNLGYISAGEWTNYTVLVSQSGLYTLNARVASQLGGGSFHLKMDGRDITKNIAVPATGGWTKYQTVTIPGIQFSAGTHILQFWVDTEPFNINYFDFTLDMPLSVQQQSSSDKINIYPNPSSGDVFIELNQTEQAMISISDLSGKIVYEVTYNKSSGPLKADVSNLAPGPYFVKTVSGKDVSVEKLIKR